MGINLSKEESMKKISLRKEKVISLAKERDLSGVRSRVALILDFSYSMEDLFDNGTVQSIIERIIPLALHFDDNGELDFWIFQDDFKRLDGITLDNFYGLANEVRRHNRMGGTKYAPVMQDVDRFYIEEEPVNIPNYVIFITDGDNQDKEKAEEIISKISNHPIFLQFIGVGDDSFDFLEKLDEMDGRYMDNANFFSVADINSMSDDDLYDKLFAEFPSWLKDAKVQDMLRDVKSLAKVSSIEAPKKKGFFSKLFGK